MSKREREPSLYGRAILDAAARLNPERYEWELGIEKRRRAAIERRIRALEAGAPRQRRRVITVDQVTRAHDALWRLHPERQRPSQDDVAKKLNVDRRTLQRTLNDEPGLWQRLAVPPEE